MASYTNRKGDVVEVTQEHLDTAIEIKLELQKQSPSGRCSWARHKRMMKKEGFDDSASNESYRQMVKAEQKKRGMLPTVASYADMVTDKKLQSVKDEIGELSIAKRSAQNSHRELNKMKREWSDRILLFDEIGEHVKEVDFNREYEELEPLEITDNEMIVAMSDWHIGLKTEEFDFEVANKRIREYAQNVSHYAKIFNVNTVNVAGIGDLINGSYMRRNQLAENEFSFSEQISKATEIVFTFLQLLSTELNVVYVGSIIGNHSRMSSGARDNAQEGDSGENIIDETIMNYIKLSNNKRLTADNKKINNRELSLELNGVKLKGVHGDNIKKNDKDKVGDSISVDGVMYDALMYGHFHHTSYVEENLGRYAIGMGCLQGATEFSKKIGFNTNPSQTIIVLEGQRITPIKINFEN